MSGHFGPGVIGKEQFDAEQLIVARGEDVFGPGVLDPAPVTPPAAPAAPEGTGEPTEPTGLAALVDALNDGPVSGTSEPAASSSAPEGEAPAYLTLSVNALTAELEANPAAFDGLMQREFLRPNGPRKGALRALQAAELKQAEPRAEVLAVLLECLNKDGGE